MSSDKGGSSAAARVTSSGPTNHCSESTSVSEVARQLLKARGVTKRFGTLAALNDVSFEIREGEILGVIGPNGAGKTTLVNVISGSAPGWTGEIRVRDSSLRRLRPHRL